MASILTRTHRATFFIAFGLIGLSLFSPMVALANADLGSGDQGTVSDTANLRSEPSFDAAVVATVGDGASVSILDGPITASDGSLWYSVTSLEGAGYLPADAIAATSSDSSAGEDSGTEPESPFGTSQDAVAEIPAVEAATMAVVPKKDVIDYGVVVDNTDAALPADGLACRTDAHADAEIILRVAEGSTLEITGDTITTGDIPFYPVNCVGQSGFVNGDYVVLASAQSDDDATVVVDETVTAEIAADTVAPTVTEEVFAAETATSSMTEQVAPATVEPTATVEELAAETVEPTASVEEVPTETVVSSVTEAVVAEEVALGTIEPTMTEEVAAAEPTATEAIVEEVAVAEPTATEEVAAEEVVTVEPTATVEAVVTVEPTAPEQVVAKEVAPATAEPTVTKEVAAVEPMATEQVVAEEIAPETVEPTASVEEVAPSRKSLTVVFDESVVSTPPPATSARAGVTTSAPQQQGVAPGTFRTATTSTGDAAARSIGSAEVQGTNGAGLRCRSAPNATAPTISVLSESSFVLVHAEPRDGYLGVICAGQAGWADVDFLWSGGADAVASSDFTAAAAYARISGTNGDGVRCRRSPSTSAGVIAIIPEGTSVLTLGAASGGWVPVNCYGYSGFVSASFISFDGGTAAPAPTGGTVQVTGTGGGLRCRSSASLSGGIITILPDGTSLMTRGGASGGWLPVACAGQNGFVSTQFVTSGGSTAPAPTTPAPGGGSSTVIGWGNISGTGGMGIRCRSAASTSASVITVIPEGTQVGLRGAASDGWMPINCFGNNGFVSAMYVYMGTGSTPAPAPAPTPIPAPAPVPTGMVANDNAKTTSNVNLRYSASTGAGIATVVPSGTVVKVTGGVTSNFYPVDWDGLRGFLSADFLVKTSEALSERGGSAAPAPPTTDGGTTPTGNAMADFALRYKGYPYRWANHGPSAFDCSGFTYWVTFNVTGKNIGYGLWTQATAGTPVSRSSLQPGDLVFFQNTYKAGLSHSGVYIGNDQFIHAENETTGVKISDLNSTYYGSRWYGAVRMT